MTFHLTLTKLVPFVLFLNSLIFSPLGVAGEPTAVSVVMQIENLPVDTSHAQDTSVEGVQTLNQSNAQLLLNSVLNAAAISASTLYLISPLFPEESDLSSAGAGLFAATTGIGFLQNFFKLVTQGRGTKWNQDHLFQICDLMGQAASTAGFCGIAARQEYLVSSWLITGGFFSRTGALAGNVLLHRTEAESFNSRMILNIFFYSITANIGAMIMSVGTTIGSPHLITIGAYIIGGAVGTGSLINLISDLRSMFGTS